MPFDDESFKMVVFDPPHLPTPGKIRGWAKKYGVLPSDWRPVHKGRIQGVHEGIKTDGVLIFKWNEEQIKTSEILDQH